MVYRALGLTCSCSAMTAVAQAATIRAMGFMVTMICTWTFKDVSSWAMYNSIIREQRPDINTVDRSAVHDHSPPSQRIHRVTSYCARCFSCKVDDTKIRNTSKAPMKTLKQSGVVLGVLVPAKRTAISLVDCLMRFSF